MKIKNSRYITNILSIKQNIENESDKNKFEKKTL